jgi:hypothetical protein
MTRSLVLLRALPMTFAVYVVNGLLAIVLAASLGIELEQALGFPLGRPAARVAALESVLPLAPLLRAKGVDLLLVSATLWLLAPWLQMAWLTSLSALHGPARALRSAWSLYFRAIIATLLVVIGGALALLPWAGLAYAVHTFCEDRVNDRVHDLSVAIALGPALIVLLISATWHDLARARCLSTGAFRSVLAAARDALRPSVLARYLAWGGAGLLLVVAAQAWAFQVQTAGFMRSSLLLALLQSAAFLRTLLRSAWLADALACVDAAASRKQKRAA